MAQQLRALTALAEVIPSILVVAHKDLSEDSYNVQHIATVYIR